MKNLELSSNYGDMINGAVNGGIDYLRENPGIKSFVVGISGGIDSAVAVALARQTVNRLADEGREVKIHGYSLSILSNKPDEIKRANAIGKAYCDTFTEMNLANTFMTTLEGIDFFLCKKLSTDAEHLSHKEKVQIGNIKARIRMIFLYNRANKEDGLVLSTDNLTEYYLGFWTLHGDVGDFGFIQELWKTEVYGMGEIIGGPTLDCVNANPTDGLGITNSDIDQLLPNWAPDMGNHRAAYKLVDEILINHLSQVGTYPRDNPVIQRYEATHFKRANPVNIKRDMLLWRHNSSKYITVI